MIQILEQHHERIAELCLKYGVQSLEIFGSAAGDTFNPETSDLDFLVDYFPSEAMDASDQYFGLKEELERLFRRDIDLVMVKALRNPYFVEEVNKTRRVLYAA